MLGNNCHHIGGAPISRAHAPASNCTWNARSVCVLWICADHQTILLGMTRYVLLRHTLGPDIWVLKGTLCTDGIKRATQLSWLPAVWVRAMSLCMYMYRHMTHTSSVGSHVIHVSQWSKPKVLTSFSVFMQKTQKNLYAETLLDSSKKTMTRLLYNDGSVVQKWKWCGGGGFEPGR